MSVKVKLDGNEMDVKEGSSVLAAAREAGVYIPALCSHPDLPPLEKSKPSEHIFRGAEKIAGDAPPDVIKGCQLCLVEIEGKGMVTSCNVIVEEGMDIKTDSTQIKEQRQKNLVPILSKHPHACLTCAQQEGCVREPCSSSVPVIERCCVKFGKCELQKVVNFIGVRAETPKYAHRGLPVLKDEPLFTRDFNLCINCGRCVRVCQDVRGVGALGFIFKDGERIVGLTRAQDPKNSDCRFCCACVEVCPTGALLDKEAIFETEREALLVPCRNACPAGANIPEYVRLVSLGKPEEAIEVIRERALLPLVLGYICLRPCESKCRRAQVDEPISIREVKKHAARKDGKGWRGKLKLLPETGKKVAIVGAGPAGITAAFLLHLKGHSVALLESGPRIGGVLYWGIPSFRLPRKALEDDLAELTGDVLIKTGVKVGEDVSLEKLAGSVDAVLLATGLPRSRKLKVEGAELQGVLWGLDFLREYNSGKKPLLGKRTVIIGGGNVAIDVARAAARSGTEDVVMACLESRETLPASPSEVEEALDEGIEVMPSWGPNRILGNDRVTGIELMVCTSVFDEKGRFDPKFDDKKKTTLEADTIIFAIGQDADLSYITPESGIKTGRSSITVNDASMTTKEGIFAAGDIVKQPGSVVDAVAAGRKAAAAIDKYLGGNGNVDFELWARTPASPNLGHVEGFGKTKRAKGKKRKNLDGDIIKDSEPVEQTLEDKDAIAEASRCLQCDLRLTICRNPSPPDKWHAFTTENIAQAPSSDGVFVLLDEKKGTLKISGVQNIRQALESELLKGGKAKYFHFEEDKMYTKKESELLQQYLQQHGKMPGGGEEEDELF